MRTELSDSERRGFEKSAGADAQAAVAFAEDEDLIALMALYRDRSGGYGLRERIAVPGGSCRGRGSARGMKCFRGRARLQRERPGTLRDCAAQMEYVAEMGFDVLYLPPIHPIGVTERKGKNNSTTPAAGDPGKPVGDRFERGRAQSDPSRAWELWRICKFCERKRSGTESNWRWISRFSVRRITRM